jgi:hypothetical protein
MTIEPNEKQSQDKNPFSKFHPITKRMITTIDLIIVFVFIYYIFQNLTEYLSLDQKTHSV